MADLTPPEHEHNAAIDEGALWLATTPKEQRPRPAVIELRERFGLCPADACKAIAEANLIRARSL